MNQAEIINRSDAQCELCSSKISVDIFEVPGEHSQGLENKMVICEQCLSQSELPPDQMNTNHWHCLNESMWSEHPSVQIMAWRILNKIKVNSWAQDLLDQLYLDESLLLWAQEGQEMNDGPQSPTKDSNGTTLQDGDAVTLIKDLDVKGANFTAKRGTLVKKISLTDNPEHIEGRVNGTQIVLLTKFLKKA